MPMDCPSRAAAWVRWVFRVNCARGRFQMVHRLAYGLALICSSTFLHMPVVHAQTRGVVELFTSQGCSSCPPADRVLADLAGDPSLVAISVPIDYWDYLGWKDTLASPKNTAVKKLMLMSEATARSTRRKPW